MLFPLKIVKYECCKEIVPVRGARVSGAVSGRQAVGRRSTPPPHLRHTSERSPRWPPGRAGKGAGAVATGGGGGHWVGEGGKPLGVRAMEVAGVVCRGEKLGQYYLTARRPLTRPPSPRQKKTAHPLR